MLTIINAFDLSINMAHSGSTLRPKSTYLPSCWKGWKDGKEYIKMSYHLSSIIHFCFLLCNEHYSLKGVLYIFSVVDYCLIIKTNFIMISAVRISVLFFYYTQKNQNGLLIIWSSICLYCIYLSAVFCSTDTLNYSHWPLLHLTASSFFFVSSALSLYSCPLMPKPDSIQVRLAWRRSAHTSSHPPCPGAQWGTTCSWNQPTQTAPPPFQPTTHGASPAQVKN